MLCVFSVYLFAKLFEHPTYHFCILAFDGRGTHSTEKNGIRPRSIYGTRRVKYFIPTVCFALKKGQATPLQALQFCVHVYRKIIIESIYM